MRLYLTHFKNTNSTTFLKLLTSPPVLVGPVLFILFSFLSCPIVCLYVLSSVLWCPLRYPHKNYVRFVFTSSCLIHVICVCLCIVVSNTYCVVSLLCLSFAFCAQCCQFLWIVNSRLPLRYSLTFIFNSHQFHAMLFNMFFLFILKTWLFCAVVEIFD